MSRWNVCSVVYRYSLSIRFAMLLACILSAYAYCDIGFYHQHFDPIFNSEIEGALKAASKYRLSKIILIPDPKSEGRVPLDVRWKLLKLAVQGHPQLEVPELEDLQLLKGNAAERERFFGKYNPRAERIRPIVESKHDERRFSSDVFHSPIRIVDRFQLFDGRKPHVRIATPVNSSKRFLENPAMGEGLLPKAVAKVVSEQRLYGHSGQRGIYGLPDAVSTFLDFEQLLNDKVQDIENFFSIKKTDLPKKYFPEMRPTFRLSHVDVPTEEVKQIETGQLPYSLQITKEGKPYVRFFVHPHSKPLYEKLLGKYGWQDVFWATPTSSHRSIIAWDPNASTEPFGLKVSLNAMIGENLRLLSKSQIERAAAVSALLQQLDHSQLKKNGILFIDEPAGVYLKDGETGFAERSIEDLKTHNSIPLFSLYSKLPSGRTLLAEMIQRSGLSPEVFLERHIMKPLIDQYHYLGWNHALVGEPHEQNLKIAIENGLPTGTFLYRDLAGFTIKPELLNARGRELDFLPEGITPKALRSSRAKLIDNAVSYLLHSNFFAMRKAVEEIYPEISERWVKNTFYRHMSRNVEAYAGSEARNITQWNEAVRNYCKVAFRRIQ